MDDVSRGKQVAAYYKYLLDNPAMLVNYNSKSLETLRKICAKSLSPAQTLAAASLAGPQSQQGWEKVAPGAFTFPSDDGPHWDFRREWYYLACSLTAPGYSQPITIILSILRHGTVPSFMRNPGQSAASAQVISVSASVEIPQSTNHPYTDITWAVYGDADGVSLRASPFEWVASSSVYLKQHSTAVGDSMFPMDAVIKDEKTGLNVTLTISPFDPNPVWFAEGDAGCAPCLDGVGYRYYSYPSLQVTGSVQIGSEVLIPSVTGSGWLDHQWESGMTPLGYVSNAWLRAAVVVGQNSQKTPFNLNPPWNWFLIHLDNKTQITAILLPAPAVSKGMGPFKLTNAVLLGGSASKFHKKELNNGRVTYHAWVTHRETKYPSGWTLEFPDDDIVLYLTTTLPPPSGFGMNAGGDEFMETGVVVTGTVDGNTITGSGVAEAIGWRSTENQVKDALRTLDQSDKDTALVNQFLPHSPDSLLVFSATMFLFWPLFVVVIITVVLVAVLVPRHNRLKKARAAS